MGDWLVFDNAAEVWVLQNSVSNLSNTWCCFTLKLPSPAPVTRATPSHLAQALLRNMV